ncbi:MAG: ATP-dependent helicase HrpB [Bacteroidota bacterium]
MTNLPIDNILGTLKSVLKNNRNCVLTAEPGAGKTTRVPVALLEEEWLRGKKIIMLEPRRLAAIRSAEYMAEQMNQSAGETIGYRIRGESKIGKSTRLEVVTEGVLTRLLQEDASLPDAGLIIFDEFHERSIHADLGLALSLDVQEHLRPDLKLLVMSATIDSAAVSTLMGDAPVVSSEGRSFPVEVKYVARPERGFIEPLIVQTVITALREHTGDILVFLPGQREIRAVELLLQKKELSSVSIHPLFGDSPAVQQRSALLPAATGRRKIILSTNIAETSLTIDGVRIVIDAGLMRTSKFDARKGMSGLSTVPVSQASADQRKGRAGRQASGVCYRLWSEAQHTILPKFSKPEITEADLASVAMELAVWGDGEGNSLRFLDRPPKANLAQARELLQYLGALDKNKNLTSHGKLMSTLPVHPRFAHMLIQGKSMNLDPLACEIAALLDERDVFRGKSDSDVDLFSRYSSMKDGIGVHRYALQKFHEQSSRLKKMLDKITVSVKDKTDAQITVNHIRAEEKLGLLLALAYPERVAKRKSGGKYQLSGNVVAALPKGSILEKEEYLAIGDVDGAGSDVKIFLAESITEQEIRSVFAEQIIQRQEVLWDAKEDAVIARHVTNFGAIELFSKSFQPESTQAAALIVNFIREAGLQILPWSIETESLRKRSEWLRMSGIVQNWIDCSDAVLLETLEVWLTPFLEGITRRSHLSRLNMMEILHSLFTYEQRRELERLAPTHLMVPTGSRITVDYSSGQPILAVRLQEMFGEVDTPTVGGGKVRVVLHLLSPARRPIGVTQDLPSFWKNAYVEVRKDMRGQYPKHYWPENPLEAEPTTKTKKAMMKNKDLG